MDGSITETKRPIGKMMQWSTRWLVWVNLLMFLLETVKRIIPGRCKSKWRLVECKDGLSRQLKSVLNEQASLGWRPTKGSLHTPQLYFLKVYK